MKTLDEISKALNLIRETLDADVVDVDINNVNNKLLKLTQLTGLSAETVASSQKLLNLKEEIVFYSMDKNIAPSIQCKILKAKCGEENAVMVYADRLNAAITHASQGLITTISRYKEEMRNSLIQANQK